MAAKSNHNKSIIPLSFFVAVGAIMAFAILLQSPSLAFADDSTKGVKDVTQTDAQSPAPMAPAPAPAAPAEGVAGGGTTTDSIAGAPPASPVAVNSPYFGSWRKSGNRWWFSYPCGCFAKGWKEIGGTWYFEAG